MNAHDDSSPDVPSTAELVEIIKRARRLWVKKNGDQTITCYATRSGLVIFIDRPAGGWTMLTECPSNKWSENLGELDAMVSGDAKPREATP